MTIKIVADSSADIKRLEGVEFESVPLKIITSKKEYVDDKDLDVELMVKELSMLNDKSGTACPSVGDWLSAFGEAQKVFCVTITSGLSGSYNSALIAKSEYEESYPDREVFVIDSLSAGPELNLIIEKLKELILQGKEFSEICKKITQYQKHTGLIFMLESLKNLANNGRVSKIVAGAVGILGIRVVAKASDKGDIEQLAKSRGEKNGLITVFQSMKKFGYCGGKVKIGNCNNKAGAEELVRIIKADFPDANTDCYPCGGLCSFYAENGGLLVGFEKGIC